MLTGGAMKQATTTALVLYKKPEAEEGLPFELFLRELERQRPDWPWREIILSGLWPVCQKVAQTYSFSFSLAEREELENVTGLVSHFINVGIGLKYWNFSHEPLSVAVRRSVKVFLSVIDVALDSVQPGEFIFRQVFERQVAVFFASLVKQAREYEQQVDNLLELIERQNKINWKNFLGIVSYIDIDHYSSDRLLSSYLMRACKLKEELVLLLFFRSMNIKFGDIPPMIFGTRIFVANEWIDTQLILAVGRTPIKRDYITVEEYERDIKRFKKIPVSSIVKKLQGRWSKRTNFQMPENILYILRNRIVRLKKFPANVNDLVATHLLIPLDEQQTTLVQEMMFGQGAKDVSSNWDLQGIFDDDS